MLVLKNIGINIQYDFSLENKKTARCPEQFVGHDENGKKYLVVFARTETQRYYAKRSITNQKKFLETNFLNFKCNKPIFMDDMEDGYYAIYSYFEDMKEIRGEFPHDWLLNYYTFSQTVENNDRVVRRIEEDFLESWPPQYRESIKKLNEFNEFHEELYMHDTFNICFQHGDFTPNNLLEDKHGHKYIMDFEFAQSFQPIGFDLFDYHYATDKKYDGIPYLKLNEIKERLQNKANQLVDSAASPKLVLETQSSIIFRSWADNLIYNRPDIFSSTNSRSIKVMHEGITYSIFYLLYSYKAELCIWLRKLPAVVIDYAVDYIFQNHKFVLKININYSSTNCKNSLTVNNNWVIFLPESYNEIEERLSKKSKYNLNRSMRLLQDEKGKIRFEYYVEEYIPNQVVQSYFNWKKGTHGTEYKLSSEEYIAKYHITNAIALYINDDIISVLFYNKCEESIYLENLSYNINYSKYSPGLLLYKKFLERMVIERANVVFLGDGHLSYKTRFGAIEYQVYSGEIFRNKVVKVVNVIEKKIKRVLKWR